MNSHHFFGFILILFTYIELSQQSLKREACEVLCGRGNIVVEPMPEIEHTSFQLRDPQYQLGYGLPDPIYGSWPSSMGRPGERTGSGYPRVPRPGRKRGSGRVPKWPPIDPEEESPNEMNDGPPLVPRRMRRRRYGNPHSSPYV